MQLYYDKQAERWEETLPIGNGSLGAMIWGTVKEERLGLNQDTIWSGYQRDKNNPNAAKYLEQVRQLVFAGKCVEAEKLIEEHMLGEYNESYLPLGDLKIRFHHSNQITEYKRVLDIDHSVACVSYKENGILYTREYFASYPANAIFINLLFSIKQWSMRILKRCILRTIGKYIIRLIFTLENSLKSQQIRDYRDYEMEKKTTEFMHYIFNMDDIC